MQYYVCLPACHVTINQHQKTVNMQMCYLIINLLP